MCGHTAQPPGDKPLPDLTTLRVSPSSLGYLLHECERCFVREHRDGVRRPGRIAEIYNVADRAMKSAFDTGQFIDIGAPQAPRFKVLAHNWKVFSAPIPFEEFGVSIVIAGSCDAYVETEDGLRLVVDYKTTTTEVNARRVAGQLRAYGLALNNPGEGAGAQPQPVDGHALLVFTPEKYVAKPNGVSGMYGATRWLEVAPDDEALMSTLRRVAALLSGVTPPKPNARCPYCIYYGAVAPIIGAA
ncbi:MAG TPA: PD-(D/E)XK nuclease family protein [Candidatus Baltobacteraceae bacterium]|nr:PD-(D/E)XK nuclease family protein [Candidatus Baltobacteraceae bacterium]